MTTPSPSPGASPTPPPRATTPGQWLALAIGAAYTLVGVAGFFVTGLDGFASDEGELLLIFEVNPLHNIVHLVIGVLGLVLWRSNANARMYGWILAIGYGAAAVYGAVIGALAQEADILALNGADNWLHVISGVLGIVILASSRPIDARGATMRGAPVGND